jgi:plastocyanin
MRRMAGMMLGAALMLGLAACSGGGGGEKDGPANCSPSGTKVKVTAEGFQFDTDCLSAPADTAFTIAFDNEDAGTPHNVAITDAEGNTSYKGEIFNGVKTETYQVDPLGAGTYGFHCDVHPSMKGTFVVQ